jgi:hypothetical protein
MEKVGHAKFLGDGLVLLGPQLFMGDKEIPSKDKFVPSKNGLYMNKPLCGGLWTSSLTPGGSYWTEWCDSESRGTGNFGWVLRPDPSKVYVIHELSDLEELTRSFPVSYPAASMARYTDMRKLLDFESMSNAFDAIHLTEDGQWATRLSEPNLYGWDCECTLWLRWRFDDFQVQASKAEARC